MEEDPPAKTPVKPDINSQDLFGGKAVSSWDYIKEQ